MNEKGNLLMAEKVKNTGADMTTAEAIESGLSGIVELGEEMREWASNMESGGLDSTEKFSMVDECAGILEEVPDSIDLPENPADFVVTVTTGTKRHTPRWLRRDNALAHLTAAKDELEAVRDQLDEVISEIEEAVGGAEGADFPGMF